MAPQGDAASSEPPHFVVYSHEVGALEWVERATGRSFPEVETELIAMKEDAMLMRMPPVVWMITRSDHLPAALAPQLVRRTPVSSEGED